MEKGSDFKKAGGESGEVQLTTFSFEQKFEKIKMCFGRRESNSGATGMFLSPVFVKYSVWGSPLSPGGGHDNPLRYSCLENPMDGGAWRATVHVVPKSDTIEQQTLCGIGEGNPMDRGPGGYSPLGHKSWTWLSDWARTHAACYIPS